MKFPLKSKKLPSWEGKVLEQKQKQFWNQWANGNNLAACKNWNFKLCPIRITLRHTHESGWMRWEMWNDWARHLRLCIFRLTLSSWKLIVIVLIKVYISLLWFRQFHCVISPQIGFIRGGSGRLKKRRLSTKTDKNKGEVASALHNTSWKVSLLVAYWTCTRFDRKFKIICSIGGENPGYSTVRLT